MQDYNTPKRNASFISSEAMGNVTPPEELNSTQEALNKYNKDADTLSGITARSNRMKKNAQLGAVDQLRTNMEDSLYSEMLSESTIQQWHDNVYINPSAFQAQTERFNDLLKDVERLTNEGRLVGGIPTPEALATAAGADLPIFAQAQGQVDEMKRTIQAYGSGEGFLESSKRVSAVADTTFMGRGTRSQVNMGVNMQADGALKQLAETYPMWEGNAVQERFTDVAWEEVNAPWYKSMWNTLEEVVMDVPRVFAGEQKVLFVDGMFGDNVSNSMTRALNLDDPIFQEQAKGYAENIDTLSKLDPNDTNNPLAPALSGVIKQYGKQNVIDILSNAKNVDAMNTAFNLLDQEKRMGAYTQDRELTLAMYGELIGHGVVVDPSMAVDIGLGMGLAIGGAATGLVPVAAGGVAFASGRAVARTAQVLKIANRANKIISSAKSQALLPKLSNGVARAGFVVEKSGRIMVNARRVLPTQVFSELLFPTLKYMGRPASAAVKAADAGADLTKLQRMHLKYSDWANYLADDAYLTGKTRWGKAMQRLIQNGVEGGGQGFVDYFVMQNAERGMLEAMHGADAADALQTDPAGLMLMTVFGAGMGGAMGAGMGGIFDGATKMSSGMLSESFAKKVSENALMKDLAKSQAYYSQAKSAVRKSKFVKKMKARGFMIDETEIDGMMHDKIRALDVDGYNTDYAFETALNDLKAKEGTTEVDMKAFLESVDSHADTRARLFEATTGRPRQARTMDSLRLLEERSMKMNGKQWKAVEDSNPDDYTADKMNQRDKDPKVRDATVAAEATREDLGKATAERDKTVADINETKTQLNSLKDGNPEEAAGDKGELTALLNDLEEGLTAKQDRVAEAKKADATARAEQRDAVVKSEQDYIAGNEDEFIKRLYHLARRDVNDRLKKGGQGSVADDVTMGNVHKLLDAKEAKGEDSVSTAALARVFTPEELEGTHVGPDSVSRSNRPRLKDLLEARDTLTVAEARDLIEKARLDILDGSVNDYTHSLLELDSLGRVLGDDAEAKILMNRMQIESKIAMQRRTADTDDLETLGLDSAVRDNLMKELGEEPDNVKENKAKATAVVNENRQKIERNSILRMEANDKELISAQRNLDRVKNSSNDTGKPDRIKAAVDRVNSNRDRIKKKVKSAWTRVRKTEVNRLMAQVDVQNRDSTAHVMAVMAIVNRLRWEAGRAGKAVEGPDGGMQFRLSRVQVLAMMPDEYRFLINLMDAARVDETYYDLHIMQGILEGRVARIDSDLSFLIRDGAGLKADAMRTKDDLAAIELRREHLKSAAEAQRLIASERAADGSYEGGRDEESWRADFDGVFMGRESAGLRKAGAGQDHLRAIAKSLGITIPEGDISTPELIKIATAIYKADGAISNSLSEFGGGLNARDYADAAYVARVVIESLSSKDKADGAIMMDGRYSPVDADKKTPGRPSRDIKQTPAPDLARRAENRRMAAGDSPGRAKRLGNVGEVMTRKLYERTRHNERMQYLLFDEDMKPRSDEDIEKVFEWLQGIEKRAQDGDFEIDDSQMGISQSSTSIRLAPPGWIRPDAKVARSVDGWVEGLVDDIINNPPAGIATIHDAIDAAIGGMFGALNPTLGTTSSGFASAQGVNGFGLGFRTLFARSGSLPDAMNRAFEFTVGIKGAVELARKERGKVLIPVLNEYGAKLSADPSDAEVLGATARLLSSDDAAIRERVANLFFPDQKYMDADSQGSNILMANLKYDELVAALESADPMAALAENAKKLGRDGFDPSKAIDLYKVTETLVKETLDDPLALQRLVSNLQNGNATPEAQELWMRSLNTWNALINEPELASALRPMFKSSVMVDLYSAGVDEVAKNIFDNFLSPTALSDPKQADLITKIIDASGLSPEATNTSILSTNSQRRALATKLAHMLHSSRDFINGSKIKESVFGNATISNKDLGDALITARGQQFKGSIVDAGGLLMNPAKVEEMARGIVGVTGKESLTSGEQADVLLYRMLILRSAQESTRKNSSTAKGSASSVMEAQFEKNLAEVRDAMEGIEGDDAKLDAARERLSTLRSENTARSDAYQALANQNFHIDPKKSEGLLRILVGSENASKMLDHLGPLERQAMATGYFRNLSIQNEGRLHVNAIWDMNSDKTRRITSAESPLGASGFYNADGSGMDRASARRAAIMQLAMNATELTGDLPDLGKSSYTDTSMESFMRGWADMSELSDRAVEHLNGSNLPGAHRAAMVEYLMDNKVITKSMEPKEREGIIDDALETFNKLRRGNIAGRDIDNHYADLDETVRMGPWGMLDPRFNYNYRDATGIAAARSIQLRPEIDGALKPLDTLDDIANAVPQGRMFSTEEMSTTLDATDRAIPVAPLEITDTHLSSAVSYGVGRVGSVQFRASVLAITLDKFAADMNTEYTRKLAKAKDYDRLYTLYRETLAIKEEMNHLGDRNETELRSITAYGQAILSGQPVDSTQEARIGGSLRFRARSIGRRQYNKTAQWSRDLRTTERNILAIEHEGAIFTGAETWEDNMARTALTSGRGNISTWLFKAADQHGGLLAKEGPVGYVSNYDSSRLPLAAQMTDSQYLMATALVDQYTWKKVYMDHFGTEDLTPERFRQLRAAFEGTQNSAAFNLDGFDKSIREAFAPDRVEETVRKIQASIDVAGLELKEMDWVSDLGATVEGRLLFNESLTPAAQELITRELKASGRTMAELQDSVFNDTIAVNGKQTPKAFVSIFGEVISPTKIQGQAHAHLTFDERMRQLNLTKNRAFVDRMRTGAALGLHRTNFDSEHSSRMGAYDGEYGAPIKQVKRNAAADTAALDWLKRMEGKKVNAKKDRTTDLATGQRYIDMDGLESTDLVIAARQNSAIATMNMYAPDSQSSASVDFDAVMTDLAAKQVDLALVDAVNLQQMDTDLSEAAILGLVQLDNTTLTLPQLKAYASRVRDKYVRIKALRNQIAEDSVAYSSSRRTAADAGDRYAEADSLPDLQDTAAEAISQILDSDMDASAKDRSIRQLQSDSDIHNRQQPAPSQQDYDADPENIDIRDVDDRRSHNRMLRLKSGTQEQRKLDRVFAKLEASGTISKQDRLLLDATYITADSALVARVFEDVSTDSILDRGVGRASAYVDNVDSVVRRITVAKDLHEKMNGQAPFGATGVILEEIGHMVDLQMRSSNPAKWDVSTQAYMDTFGPDAMNDLDPAFKLIFGDADRTTSVSEGLARGYAAVMMSRGAADILKSADADTLEWFGTAHSLALTEIGELRRNAAVRDFESTEIAMIESTLIDMKPQDLDLQAARYLRDRGYTTEDKAWSMYHGDEPRPSSRDQAQDYASAADPFRDPADGRLDRNALLRAHPGNESLADAIMLNEVHANLEVLGAGTEITLKLASQLAGLIDQISFGWGRKVNHVFRQWVQPTAAISSFADAGYGTGKDQMTTLVRGLASLMSPTETLSLAGFSTLGGKRAPTLTALMGESKGRWDAAIATLELMNRGHKQLNQIQGNQTLVNKALTAALRLDDKIQLDILEEADRVIAGEIFDQVRVAQAMTADDMLEAGMLPSEMEANMWKTSLPVRLDGDSFGGDKGPAAEAALANHIAANMFNSNEFDVRVVEFMSDPEGNPLWRKGDTANDVMTDDDLQRFRDMGMDEFAEAVHLTHSKMSHDNANAPLTWNDTFAYMTRMNFRLSDTFSMDGTFITKYRQAITGEFTGEMQARAELYASELNTNQVIYGAGYAGLRAKKALKTVSQSGYVMYSDPFINSATLHADPEMAEFLETDLVKILDGIQRGPGSDSLDKASFGRVFGVKGLGIEDITDMLERMFKNAQSDQAHAVINKATGLSESPKRLTSAERTMALGHLKQFKQTISYAKGTLKREDIGDFAAFKMLNDLMAIATTALVAPRYLIGTGVEEMPQSAVKGFGEVLVGLRGEVRDGIMGQTEAKRKEALEGLTTFVRDIQHDISADNRQAGAENSQFLPSGDDDKRLLQKMNERMSRLATAGFKAATQKVKAHDVQASISRFKTMLQHSKQGGDSMFEGLVAVVRETDFTRGSVEDYTDVLRTLGVPSSQMSNTMNMIRAGVFDSRTASQVKELFARFSPEGDNNFGFTRAQEWIQNNHRSIEERASYREALMSIRTMLFIDSQANAKGNTVADATIQGNSLTQILTRLSSYAGMVSNSLRRQTIYGGSSVAVAQMAMYMMSGYMYFKATQLARGKSWDKAIGGQWEENPEVELFDMFASVPLLGYSHMTLSFLAKQIGLAGIAGQDQFGVRGGDAIGVASFASLNRITSMAGELPGNIRKYAAGETDLSAEGAEMLSASPVALAPVLGIIINLMGEAVRDSKETGAFTSQSFQNNKDAWFIKSLTNAVSGRGGSFDLEQIDASIRPDAQRPLTRNTDVPSFALEAVAAQTQAAQVPTAPAAPAPEPSPAPAPSAPMADARMFKAAPDTLK